MATTLTKQAASPNQLIYTFASTGGSGGTATKTAAQLIADCAEGPLKTLLSQVNAGINVGGGLTSWLALGYNPALTVIVTPAAVSGAPTDTGNLYFGISPNSFNGQSANDVTSFVRLRFNQSSQR